MSKYLLNLSESKVPREKVVHKFGRNTAVGTTFVPICLGGVYQTPQVGSETTLRIAAGGNANDTAAGTGAREIRLIGLDANGNEITETLSTNGASASSATSQSFLRLYRLYVSASGTYATQSTGSHSADIVIENSAGGTTWATLDSTDFPKSQSEIGAYSIPAGKKGYVWTNKIFADANATTTMIFFQRTGILQTAAPYDAMRMVFNATIDAEETSLAPQTPLGPFVGPCDIGFMARVAVSTADVEVDFEIVLVDD